MVTTLSNIGGLFDVQATDRCRYCAHTLAQHNRTDPPGNGLGGTRCGKGCVCSGFADATHVACKALWSREGVRTYVRPENWDVIDAERRIVRYNPGGIRRRGAR